MLNGLYWVESSFLGIAQITNSKLKEGGSAISCYMWQCNRAIAQSRHKHSKSTGAGPSRRSRHHSLMPAMEEPTSPFPIKFSSTSPSHISSLWKSYQLGTGIISCWLHKDPTATMYCLPVMGSSTPCPWILHQHHKESVRKRRLKPRVVTEFAQGHTANTGRRKTIPGLSNSMLTFSY